MSKCLAAGQSGWFGPPVGDGLPSSTSVFSSGDTGERGMRVWWHGGYMILHRHGRETNVPLKREWRTGRGRIRENVFSTLEKAMDWKSKSFSRCERLQDSKLSITHHVSLAVYPFQDLGLERGCSSGCLGRALSETGIDSASLCEFQWRPQGKSPSHEVR